jgi:hypothetical protein
MMQLGLYGAASLIAIMLNFCIATCTGGKKPRKSATTNRG